MKTRFVNLHSSEAKFAANLPVGGKLLIVRPCKPQPGPMFLERGVVDVVSQWPMQNGVRWFMADGMSELIKCPFGAPGGKLACREKWTYCRTCGTVNFAATVNKPRNCQGCDEYLGRWRGGQTLGDKDIRTRLSLVGIECRQVNSITIPEIYAAGRIYPSINPKEDDTYRIFRYAWHWNLQYPKPGPQFEFTRAWAWFVVGVKL